eukprot:762882-Hanusia_phi.AAC.4
MTSPRTVCQLRQYRLNLGWHVAAAPGKLQVRRGAGGAGARERAGAGTGNGQGQRMGWSWKNLPLPNGHDPFH